MTPPKNLPQRAVAPGLPAQGGGANQPASAGRSGKGSNETHNESKTEQTNVVSTTQTEKESFGLAPKLAKVSVGIPMSYFEKVWQGRNPVKEGEEPKKPDQAALDPIVQENARSQQSRGHSAAPPARRQGPDIAGQRRDLPGHQARCDRRPGGDATGHVVVGR